MGSFSIIIRQKATGLFIIRIATRPVSVLMPMPVGSKATFHIIPPGYNVSGCQRATRPPSLIGSSRLADDQDT